MRVPARGWQISLADWAADVARNRVERRRKSELRESAIVRLSVLMSDIRLHAVKQNLADVASDCSRGNLRQLFWSGRIGSRLRSCIVMSFRDTYVNIEAGVMVIDKVVSNLV